MITKAAQAKFVTEVATIQEQVQLNQVRDGYEYSGTINDFLNTKSSYNKKLVLQDGVLVYVESEVSENEAKWLEGLGIPKAEDFYTIEFDTSGASEIPTQTVRVGKKANKPNNPSKSGSEFVGWFYLLEGGTEEAPTYEEREFDFNTVVTSNYSLYAKYTGEAVMMARSDSQAFWAEDIRNNITSILFTQDSTKIPSPPLNTWNIRATSDSGDIMAYLEDDGAGNSTYKLTVYSQYTIYANQNATSYFEGFISLNSIEFINFDTGKTVKMPRMFFGCVNLTSLDLSQFNTNKVTNMFGMFWGCSKLSNINISNFNTSNVTNMGQMFRGTKVSILDLSSFNTSKVTTINHMFKECSNLSEINVSNWDTSKVTNMMGTFSYCSELLIVDVSEWDTSEVTNMDEMFMECAKLANIDVGNWNTSKVTSFYSIFWGCTKLSSIDVSNWDTSQVTNMQNAFKKCNELQTIDVSKWNTNKVTSMFGMFWECSKLSNIDVSKWDTKNVTNMGQMFRDCKSITTLDFSSFDTSKVTAMNCMFLNCTELKTIYASNNYVTDNVTISTYMFMTCPKLAGGAGTNYNGSHTSKEYAHIDGGASNPGYFTLKTN